MTNSHNITAKELNLINGQKVIRLKPQTLKERAVIKDYTEIDALSKAICKQLYGII